MTAARDPAGHAGQSSLTRFATCNVANSARASCRISAVVAAVPADLHGGPPVAPTGHAVARGRAHARDQPPRRVPRQRGRRGGALHRPLGDSAPRLRWRPDDAPLFSAMLRTPHAEERLGEHVGGLVDPPQHVGASFLARGARVGGFDWRGLVQALATEASFTASVQRVPGQLASAERVPNARDGGALDRDRSARARESVPTRRFEVLGVALRAPTPDSPNLRACPDPFTESVRRRRGLRSCSCRPRQLRGRFF